MDVLAPVDGTDGSFRALAFAASFSRRFEATLHVVHFSDAETDATDAIIDRAKETLHEEGVEDAPEVAIDHDLEFRPADRVGENILALVRERGFDHVVMGHHESGAVDRMFLGSAAETVLRAGEVPVTVVP